MLIRNMGLFWSENEIFWGTPGQGQKGKLLGKLATGRRAGTVDFWEQRGVYALYADYRLVYVGQTAGQALGKRVRDHRADDLAGRWDRFSWFGLRIVTEDNKLMKTPEKLSENATDVLDHVEAILTIVAEPPLNRSRGHWRKIELYLQESPSASKDEA